MQEISTCLTALFAATTARVGDCGTTSHNAENLLATIEAGSIDYLLKKTAANAKSETDERRTTRLDKSTKTASVCAHSKYSAWVIYSSQWFYWSDTSSCVPGESIHNHSIFQQTQFLHRWTNTVFMEGDVYSSKAGLIVSYEKLSLSDWDITSSHSTTQTRDRHIQRHRQTNRHKTDF